MQKFTFIQKITLILIALYLIWELFVWFWAKSQPTTSGAIIRVDLIIIYPILLLLIVISVFQYFKNKL